MLSSTLKVGICQISTTYQIEQNIAKAVDMVKDAASSGADIVALPEMFLTPYEPDYIRKAKDFTGKAIEELANAALEHGIYIVAGSLPYLQEGGKPFNRSFVFDAKGRVVCFHDKLHLFDCEPPGGPVVRESDIIRKGNHLDTFETPWGLSSVIVCYDIRFTPLLQLLADRGVVLLFVPAAFSLSTGRAHWEMLVRLRAVEIQGFVVGVQPAYNPDLKYIPWGHSIVSNPWGEVLMDAGKEEVVKVVDIDMEEVEKIRMSFPLLEHRRSDLYSTTWLGNR